MALATRIGVTKGCGDIVGELSPLIYRWRAHNASLILWESRQISLRDGMDPRGSGETAVREIVFTNFKSWISIIRFGCRDAFLSRRRAGGPHVAQSRKLTESSNFSPPASRCLRAATASPDSRQLHGSRSNDCLHPSLSFSSGLIRSDRKSPRHHPGRHDADCVRDVLAVRAHRGRRNLGVPGSSEPRFAILGARVRPGATAGAFRNKKRRPDVSGLLAAKTTRGLEPIRLNTCRHIRRGRRRPRASRPWACRRSGRRRSGAGC